MLFAQIILIIILVISALISVAVVSKPGEEAETVLATALFYSLVFLGLYFCGAFDHVVPSMWRE